MRVSRTSLILLCVLGLVLGLTVVGCQRPSSVVDADAGGGAAANVSSQAPAPDDEDDDDDDDEEENEVDVPLDEVPESIKEAAIGAVPGLVLEGAEKETENGVVVYDIAGTVNGQAYEVEVTASGEVLEIETEDDDDDDD